MIAVMIMTNFLNNGRFKINGNGKAMVVADSRANAVRYYFAIKKYLEDHPDIRKGSDVMIAFSGTVKIDGQELYYASKQLRDDYDVVLEAVKNKGLILKYASKRLRANRDIAEAAVASDKRALEYISDEALKEELSKEEEN